MAATVTFVKVKQSVPELVTEIQISGLQALVQVDADHAGPAGVVPDYVDFELVTQPDSKDPVFMSHLEDEDDDSGDTVALVFDTIPGGDLTGAVVKVYCRFLAQASGGLTNVA